MSFLLPSQARVPYSRARVCSGGIGNYIDFTSDEIVPNIEWTLMMNVQHLGAINLDGIFVLNTAPNFTMGTAYFWVSGNGLVCRGNIGNNSTELSKPVDVTKPHHYAFRQTGSEARIEVFVDGENLSQSAFTSLSNTGGNTGLRVGEALAAVPNTKDMAFGNTEFYTFPLTDAEIEQSVFHPHSVAGGIIQAPIDGLGDPEMDYSGYRNDGVIIGDCPTIDYPFPNVYRLVDSGIPIIGEDIVAPPLTENPYQMII